MADINLGELGGDTIVVHYGGLDRSVDAQTYAASLLGFAQTVFAVSRFLDPHQEIEVLVEADGGGSYRTRIRRKRKGDGGFFSGGMSNVFWGVVAGLIVEALLHTLKTEPQLNVEVKTHEVVITRGTDRIIVPRDVHDSVQNAKKDPEVQKSLEKTFAPLEADPKVTDFGLTKNMTDVRPYVQIPREVFPQFTYHRAGLVSETPAAERLREEKARLVIVKAWLNHKKRKWTFEWNGVPISAPILDQEFLDKIERREYLIGAGDALDVEIQFKQLYDSKIGTYVNDANSFVISHVIRVITRD